MARRGAKGTRGFTNGGGRALAHCGDEASFRGMDLYADQELGRRRVRPAPEKNRKLHWRLPMQLLKKAVSFEVGYLRFH